MRPPAFWNIKHGRDAAFSLRTILLPFSILYGFITQRRIKNGDYFDLGKPVISIGNISLGGTGKTPLTRHIAKKLGAKNIAIVSRGYGGNLEGPVKVKTDKHDAKQVGDEPLMLAKDFNVFVGKDRKQAALKALEIGAQLILLDDGHQNPSLKKDVSIVVIDSETGFGNGFVFPSGPLREKPKDGLRRADIIIVIGNKNFDEALEDFSDAPVFTARIRPKNADFKGKYLAFCGIGRPQKFQDTLKECGIECIDLISFPDHHYYSDIELRNLVSRANEDGAKLLTTEKDYIRIPPNLRDNIEFLEIEIEFDDETGFLNTLSNLVNCVPD